MLIEKIKQQINDLRDPMLFMAYHHEGHAIERHILSDDELRRSLWVKPRPNSVDDIVMVTRFQSKEKALEIIAETLDANVNEIAKWLLCDSKEDFEATAVFNESTGDGLAKNTDWTNTIPVHGARVILRKNFKIIGRSFVVVTAYPFGAVDDIDSIYAAIDDFVSKKN